MFTSFLFAILFEYAMITELKKAVEILREGGIILYPTDTIWGIGCDATNEKAVKRIYEIKQREETKSMLVLLDSSAKLQAYLSDVPEIAWDLIDVADKPLTIIYPQGKNLAANLLSADGTIGIRITQEIFSKRLCEMFRKPIVSTSANVSGNPRLGILLRFLMKSNKRWIILSTLGKEKSNKVVRLALLSCKKMEVL